MTSRAPEVRRQIDSSQETFPLFSDEILSKYQCGFRETFNAQHFLVSMMAERLEPL